MLSHINAAIPPRLAANAPEVGVSLPFMMKKDVVRLNEVEKEIKTKTVQEESEEHALSVDEIFAQADADLAKLNTISEQLKKESKKAKKQLNFFQRELRAFGLFVVIVILSIIVGIVYFVKTVLPEFSSEFMQMLKKSIDATEL